MLLYFSYSIFSSKKMVAIFKGFSFYFFLGGSATASRMLADTCQQEISSDSPINRKNRSELGLEN